MQSAGFLLSALLFVAPVPAQTSASSRQNTARLPAVQAEPPTAARATALFTDETGRRVDVPLNVERIVSLAPNLTEIVFALGQGDHLAGDTDFCDYPAEATLKPHVGGPVNPNLEQIVALRPGLVLATKAINRRETVEALTRLGLSVYITDPHSVDEMIASVERLGRILHAETTAVPLVEDLRARLANLDRRLAGAEPRRVLFVVWTDPLISIGRNTFIADALRHAGARSVLDTTAEWPRVSLEEIVRLQPEFVVFARAHAGDTQQDIASLRTRPGWRDLSALRRGNVVSISEGINRPAPRMMDAIEQLARALHPELLGSGDRQPRPASPASARAPHLTEEVCACAP